MFGLTGLVALFWSHSEPKHILCIYMCLMMKQERKNDARMEYFPFIPVGGKTEWRLPLCGSEFVSFWLAGLRVSAFTLHPKPRDFDKTWDSGKQLWTSIKSCLHILWWLHASTKSSDSQIWTNSTKYLLTTWNIISVNANIWVEMGATRLRSDMIFLLFKRRKKVI